MGGKREVSRGALFVRPTPRLPIIADNQADSLVCEWRWGRKGGVKVARKYPSTESGWTEVRPLEERSQLKLHNNNILGHKQNASSA